MSKPAQALAVVILAAGMGTRMKSSLPKVLHKAAGRSLLAHVLHAAKQLAPDRVVVVHGPGQDGVRAEAEKIIPDARFAVQAERLGTGHAVMMAESALAGFDGTVLTLYGDVPLIQSDALRKTISLAAAAPMAVLGFEAANPFGYGRLLTTGTTVTAIREQRDASETEQAIRLCNSGIIAINARELFTVLHALKPHNAQGELYLTDTVELMATAGKACALAVCPEADVAGVNDRMQLAAIEAEFQSRLRRAAMQNGATLVAPETVFFSADTVLGQDVLIEPNVIFGTGVRVGNNVEVLGHSHIEGATIGDGARIGPFARLRPGAEVGEKAHIGNYVEVKKAIIGKGAKVNHLTYIGDADVGAGSNIGAGTITCNYDGYEKHRTQIGENVFVGSNTALVAPVTIGAGANIAAGSVITQNVPADSLAMTRAPYAEKAGWAKKYRALKAAKKSKEIIAV